MQEPTARPASIDAERIPPQPAGLPTPGLIPGPSTRALRHPLLESVLLTTPMTQHSREAGQSRERIASGLAPGCQPRADAQHPTRPLSSFSARHPPTDTPLAVVPGLSSSDRHASYQPLRASRPLADIPPTADAHAPDDVPPPTKARLIKSSTISSTLPPILRVFSSTCLGSSFLVFPIHAWFSALRRLLSSRRNW